LESPEDLNYTLKAKKGTFEVYRDAEATDKLDLPCPEVTGNGLLYDRICDMVLWIS
jgi:hypothetical protein